MDTNNPDEWENDEFFKSLEEDQKKQKQKNQQPTESGPRHVGGEPDPRETSAFSDADQHPRSEFQVPEDIKIWLIEDRIISQYLHPKLNKMLANAYAKGYQRGQTER